MNGRSLLTGYRFREVAEFYARDKDDQSLQGIEALCLEEIQKQKARMKIEAKQLAQN